MVSLLVWFIGNIMPYITLIVFSLTLAYNFFKWMLMPRPIVWAIFPAKYNNLSIFITIVKRIFTLPGPRKFDKILWVLAWLFHIGLIVSLSLHAKYIFISNIPSEHILGSIAGLAAGIGTLGFLIRRYMIRHKVKSSFSDYFALILLMITLALGEYLRISSIVNHDEVWRWIHGILTFNNVSPPTHPLFLIHILLAQLYMIYLPFKTLIHPIAILYGQKIVLNGRHLHKEVE